MPRYIKSRALPLLTLRAFVAYKKGETYPVIIMQAAIRVIPLLMTKLVV
jgi:hypothetical protein